MGLLRFFLAFAVVNVHGHLLSHNLIYPDIAVQSFYIISGFYMAMILNEKYNRPEISYKDFILSRFFRIAPAYFFMLISTILVSLIAWLSFSMMLSPLQYWFEYYDILSTSSLIYIIAPQVSLIGLDVSMFSFVDSFGEYKFTDQYYVEQIKLWRFLAVPQGWTLSLEFYFYLLAPFIVKKTIRFILLIIVASFLIRLVTAIYFKLHLDPWSYRFFPSEIMFFLCGSIAYRLFVINNTQEEISHNKTKYFCFFLIIAAGVIGRYSHTVGNLYLFSTTVMGILFLILPKLFVATKNNKFDRYIGELSYPLYISHMLVIWVSELIFNNGGMWQRINIAFVSILLSILIYEFIDKRVDKFRHRRFSKEVKIE